MRKGIQRSIGGNSAEDAEQDHLPPGHGSDPIEKLAKPGLGVSTYAPTGTREQPERADVLERRPTVSTPRPRRDAGATRAPECSIDGLKISTHAPRREAGATSALVASVTTAWFQPTPPPGSGSDCGFGT